jgi:ribonuclease H2 subunit C
VPLPSNYVGLVVEKQLPKNDLVVEDGEQEAPLGRLETKAEFDEFVVWGHETVNDAGNDVYTRMEEWIGVAGSIHSYEGEEKK